MILITGRIGTSTELLANKINEIVPESAKAVDPVEMLDILNNAGDMDRYDIVYIHDSELDRKINFVKHSDIEDKITAEEEFNKLNDAENAEEHFKDIETLLKNEEDQTDDVPDGEDAIHFPDSVRYIVNLYEVKDDEHELTENAKAVAKMEIRTNRLAELITLAKDAKIIQDIHVRHNGKDTDDSKLIAESMLCHEQTLTTFIREALLSSDQIKFSLKGD